MPNRLKRFRIKSDDVITADIEFAATYFIMLLVLFFMGAGKYLSIDYYLRLFVRE